MQPIISVDVEAVFSAYPEQFKTPLLEIREWIFSIAQQDQCIGNITECLRWQQPSYLTQHTKSGSMIRLDRFKEHNIAVFFHCQTNLVETFRGLYPHKLKFLKNRAIVLNPTEPLPKKVLKDCLQRALTYHLQKKLYKIHEQYFKTT